jgi:hypothetical protein
MKRGTNGKVSFQPLTANWDKGSERKIGQERRREKEREIIKQECKRGGKRARTRSRVTWGGGCKRDCV